MANIRHNLKNLLLKGKSFVSVINSSKENILNGNLDKRGWQSVSVNGGGGDSPAATFLSAAGITDPTITSAVYTLVDDLNGYGLWSKMKAIYPMVGGNATAHSYNLKDTTKFQITWNGGLTHSSNGVLGNGTNGYGNTNLSPNTNLVKYNTHTSIYLRTNTDGIYCDLGASNDSFNEMVTIYSKDNGNAKSDMGNYAISRISAATSDSLGNYINSRTANNAFKLYKNSTTLGTNTSTDTNNLPLKNLTIFGINYGASPSQFSNRQCAFATIGEGLSDTEAANLYTSIQKFQTTLNRFVGTPIVSDPDAQAFLNSASITDLTQANAVNTLVTDLKGANLWTKMLGIYPLVGGTASSHAWNLRDTTKLKMRWVGGMTHDSNGVTGNGTNSYGQPDITGTTGINATNYPPLTATNYGISIYQRNTSVEYSPQFGFGYTNGYVLCSYAGGTQNYFIGITASPNNATNPNKTGLFHMYGGSGVGSGIVNGTKILTGTGGQLPDPAIGTFLWFGGNNGGGYSTRNFAFFTVSEYLNDTEAANLYTKIQNYQISLGRSVGPQTVSDPDAQLFINTANIQDQIQATAVNTLVTDLKSNNLWTKMKAVYPMVGGTATSHSYNLKNPSQFQITFSGGWTHSLTGALPNGTNAYGNTNFNPNSNITTNSAHHSFYFRTSSSFGRSASIGVITTSQMSLAPYSFNIGWVDDMFDTTVSRISANVGNSTGYVIGTRSSSSSHKLFRNNTQIASTASATTGTPPNANYFIGASNYLGSANYFDNVELGLVSLGDGLTDAESSTLYTIIQNYQTILNRQV